MAARTDLDAILDDPLAIHFALKERGSDFSKVAKGLTTSRRPISPSLVRAVVYGVSTSHRDLILGAIRKLISTNEPRRPRFGSGHAQP